MKVSFTESQVLLYFFPQSGYLKGYMYSYILISTWDGRVVTVFQSLFNKTRDSSLSITGNLLEMQIIGPYSALNWIRNFGDTVQKSVFSQVLQVILFFFFNNAALEFVRYIAKYISKPPVAALREYMTVI